MCQSNIFGFVLFQQPLLEALPGTRTKIILTRLHPAYYSNDFQDLISTTKATHLGCVALFSLLQYLVSSRYRRFSPSTRVPGFNDGRPCGLIQSSVGLWYLLHHLHGHVQYNPNVRHCQTNQSNTWSIFDLGKTLLSSSTNQRPLDARNQINLIRFICTTERRRLQDHYAQDTWITDNTLTPRPVNGKVFYSVRFTIAPFHKKPSIPQNLPEER